MVRGGGASTRRRPLGALSQPAAGAAGKAPPSRGVGKRGAAGVRKSREAEVRALAAELDAEVEKRCASIRQVANDSIIMLRNEYRRQLMRLPKKVRAMPLSKFREVHAADIDAAMLADIDRRIAGGGSRKRSAEGMADGGEERGVKVPFTPAATKGASKAEALSRMPRQGEELVSANGSPLGVFLEGGVTPAAGLKTAGGVEMTCSKTMVKARVGTVARSRRGKAGRPEPIVEDKEEEPSITIRTEDGVEVDLAKMVQAPGGLAEGFKATALEQLSNLQSTIGAILANIGK